MSIIGETEVWSSSGAWNPWDILYVKYDHKALVKDPSSNDKISKHGVTKTQQKDLATNALGRWWKEGGMSLYDSDNTNFMVCNINSSMIKPTTSIRIRLSVRNLEYEAFLFYSVSNPRPGIISVIIMGARTRKEAVEANGVVVLGDLHRTRELGMKEFRQRMTEIYEKCEKDKQLLIRKREQQRYLFYFPLKRCLLGMSDEDRKCSIDDIYTYMVEFVASEGRDTNNGEWGGWRSKRAPEWTRDLEDYALTDPDFSNIMWTKDEYASNHQLLQGMKEGSIITSYMFSGIGAAVDKEYAELRERSIRRQMGYYFSRQFDTEESIMMLLELNEMEDLLVLDVTDEALNEYKRRNPIKYSTNDADVGNGASSSIKDGTLDNHLSSLNKLREVKKVNRIIEESILPKKYGLIHFTKCPPSIIENGCGISKGHVMLFYDEIEQLVLYWMECDQIETNGLVKSNLKFYEESLIFSFISDALITAKEMTIRDAVVVGGAITTTSITADPTSKKMGELNIDMEDLLEFMPPCMKGIINNCKKNSRSMKHGERLPFSRFLAGLGIPMSVYDAISYPLFVSECKRTGRPDTMKDFKRRWDGKAMWEGKYSNITCLSIKKAMDAGGDGGDRCKCPYVGIAKFYGKNFTTMCEDEWRTAHPGEGDALKLLYFPSQIVYASLKVRRRKGHQLVKYEK